MNLAFGDTRSDRMMMRRAIKERWPISEDMRTLIINKMALIVGRSENERNQISAAQVLVSADKINVTEQEAEPQPGVNVTVNQYAAEGGTIDNKAAVDAAANWLAAVANDAGDPGGAGVVRDAGALPSPEAPGPLEQEAS